jgi:hypothetical protein
VGRVGDRSGRRCRVLKSGIFAWNGVARFYLQLAACAAWFAVITIVLMNAVEHDVVDAPKGLDWSQL